MNEQAKLDALADLEDWTKTVFEAIFFNRDAHLMTAYEANIEGATRRAKENGATDSEISDAVRAAIRRHQANVNVWKAAYGPNAAKLAQ